MTETLVAVTLSEEEPAVDRVAVDGLFRAVLSQNPQPDADAVQFATIRADADDDQTVALFVSEVRHPIPASAPGSLTGGQALLSRRSARVGLRGTMVGSTLSDTVSLVTTTLATSSRLGMSYITGSRTSSMMARRPRAPVPR